jgi:hypothetical protein
MCSYFPSRSENTRQVLIPGLIRKVPDRQKERKKEKKNRFPGLLAEILGEEARSQGWSTA